MQEKVALEKSYNARSFFIYSAFTLLPSIYNLNPKSMQEGNKKFNRRFHPRLNIVHNALPNILPVQFFERQITIQLFKEILSSYWN